MKPPVSLAAAFLVLALAPARAPAQLQDEIEVTRAVMQAERKLIVSQNLGLSESESEAFWPIYNEYHREMTQLNDTRVELLKDLAAEFESLDDERAVEFEYLVYLSS